MKKTKSKLAVKLIMSFVILGVLLCAVSSSIGYYQFKVNLEKQYNTTAYQIADEAVTFLDEIKIDDYVSLIKRTINGEDVSSTYAELAKAPEYEATFQKFCDLRESMEANDIFLVYIDEEVMNSYEEGAEDWCPVYYIYDAYENIDQRFNLGDNAPFNPQFIKETQEILDTCQRSDNYFFSKSQFGYNTYAMQPVPIGDDVLLLGVEIPMTIIEGALFHYLFFAVLVAILIVAIGIILYVIYLSKNVIKPINTISDEARAFIKNGELQLNSLESIKTGDEVQNLAEGFMKMQNDINDYIDNITKITTERERLGAELDVAKNIQASMLPCIFPAFPGRKEFDIHASMSPAKEVGGDFYDFFMIDDDHLALVIADVSGKGIPAALFMMISKMLIKNAAQSCSSPKTILETVNNQLYENNEEQMFVTVWLGIMEISTGKIVCSNAGHEYPAIYKKGEGFSLFKDKHGFVLAGMQDMKYREYELQLNPGDMLYVYTDGVPEATNSSEEMYGTDRMIDALNSCPNKEPVDLDKYVRQDIDKFVAEAEQFDDITMLCIHYFGNEKEESSDLTVDATVENYGVVNDFVVEKLNELNCPTKLSNKVLVAVEEIYVNIAHYAYKDTVGSATIKVSVLDNPSTVKIVFEDNGTPYDPTAKEDPDITLSAEERKIGGLGIFMTKKLMDKVTYSNEGNKNILTIFKEIE